MTPQRMSRHEEQQAERARRRSWRRGRKRLAALLLSLALAVALAAAALAGCGGDASTEAEPDGALKVVGAESFLTDIAQNVAGERFRVATLIPVGTDPHAYQPAPKDLAKATEAHLLIVNGGGLESALLTTLEKAAPDATVVTASAGLHSREPHSKTQQHAAEEDAEHHHGATDPHFWLNPVLVERYVANIRDAFSEADPDGADVYAANAARYTRELRALDAWIAKRVATIPPKERILVTNHESAGYFADRYGFTIVGTVIPAVSTDDSPSAQQLSALTAAIRDSGAKAIFVETGANPQLARQIAAEAGVELVTDLRDHSLTPAGGAAPTYIAMMKHNVRVIVAALR